MKIFKLLFAFVFLASVFIACEEDDNDVSYAFQNISAPTNVVANFAVAQDDTGMVTVTPAGEGASTFDIYFGAADNEEAVTVDAGESASYTYPEGEYTVRVVGVGPTGLTSEYAQLLTIAFRAPENLMVNVVQPASDPANITVSASADYATLFHVWFGDIENEEATQLMPGASLAHFYETPGEYILKVVAIGAGVATTEYMTTIVVPEANDPIVLPITFDSATVNYAMSVFNGASFEVVENPDLSGVNTTASKVGALTNTGNNYEGGAFTLGTPINFAGSNKTIKMKMWSDVSVPVLLKFEGGVNGERQNEVSVTHMGTGWEELTFDFSTDAIKSYIDGNQGVGEPFVPTGQYASMVIFVDGAGTTAGTFYFDDIKQVQSNISLSALVEDFEGTPPVFTVFGNIAATEVVANPDASGLNTSANVAKLTKTAGAETWAGTYFEIPAPLDLDSYSSIKIKTWAPKSGITVKLKLENEDSSITHEVDAINTTANAWEELVYDFSEAPAADYVRIVIFFDFDVNGDDSAYYYDDIELINGDGSIPALGFQDFEGDVPAFTVFGNIADTQVINNPDASGINTSAMVAQLTKTAGAETWAGTYFELASPLDLASYSKISVKTWSPKSGITIKLKLENQDSSVTYEVDAVNSIENGWEELVYDFSEAPSADYVRVVIFFDFDVNGDDSVYYFDEFALTN